MGSLFRRPLLIVDTETTGFLNNPNAQPWEIGAVLLDEEGAEVATFSEMGRPEVLDASMKTALDIGGVRAEDLLDLPPMREIASRFIAWIPDVGASMTAFNVAFDRPMLNRLGIDHEFWAPCIMERAKKEMGAAGALPWFNKYGDYKMPKLSEAAAFYSVPQQEPAHRALADARTAGLVAIALQRRALKGGAP